MGSISPEILPNPEEDAAPGSICQAHYLYQTKPDQRGRTSWTSEVPSDLLTPAEGSKSSKYALLVRNTKSYDGRKSLDIHSIVVQSELLKKFLANVMAGYPGLTMTLDRVQFHQPFKPFVHRWEQFCQAKTNETDPAVRTHVELLYSILSEELSDTMSRKNDLVKNEVVTHDLLWTIFEPGHSIFSIENDLPRVFEFTSSDTDRCGNFVVNSMYIDYDGENFGYRSRVFKISPFEGTSPITSLSVFPLVYHSKKAAIQKDLVARGKIWEAYRGYHYKQYQGIAQGYFLGRLMKFSIKSRIVIDTEAYNTCNPDLAISVDDPTSKLCDDQRLVCTPILRGFSLKDKKWLEFCMSGVEEIVWNMRAFDSLVLPNSQQDLKRLILAFTRAQSKNVDTFDDVIQGKGRGAIILLKGPPGVGKTLTAESVADVMKVPLYVLSAGDLGTNSERVESSLRDILTMVPKWGAVLLIDEADVFLEARDKTDLKRNELVSIFLRLLEYYEGILFLTTNRAENIDPAFESRIHVSIQYPELDSKARHQIWSRFCSDSNGGQLSSEELDLVSEIDLNGRQIKNILRTAHLLAHDEGSVLKYEHVQLVLNLRKSEQMLK